MPSAESYRTDLIVQLVRENERVAALVLEGVRSGLCEKIEGWAGGLRVLLVMGYLGAFLHTWLALARKVRSSNCDRL